MALLPIKFAAAYSNFSSVDAAGHAKTEETLESRKPLVGLLPAVSIECATSASGTSEGEGAPQEPEVPEQSTKWVKHVGKKPSVPVAALGLLGSDGDSDFGTWPSTTTTVMIRNVPNRYLSEELLMDFCQEGFHSAIDFFYLPADFTTKRNKSYAFVNLRDAVEAARFRDTYHGCRFERYSTKKVIECCPAVDQGFCANVRKHNKGNKDTGHIKNPWFMPMVFQPAPHGSHLHCAPLCGGSLPAWVQQRLTEEEGSMSKQAYPPALLLSDHIPMISSQRRSTWRFGFVGSERCSEEGPGCADDFETCAAIEKQVRDWMLLAKVGLPPGLPAPRDEASLA